jgi:hypothetical protein
MRLLVALNQATLLNYQEHKYIFKKTIQTVFLHYLYSETCIRRNRKGPKIFSTLDKFPHYTKLQKKKKC